ncbi:DUF3021 family protein [Ruminococcus sp.]|uniref:DUF3021 family protein n=1 Tax=Ruminococcus sp. TaxID=41978 RepID=UPI0025DFE3EB|nr:DUF3021 family protein [Ruminococcus sp.]MCR4638346.1 DUF3021 domain-containing protein [Ruminococcus sp.]
MIKEFFVSLLHYFVDITTAILIAAAIFLTISGQQIDSIILWEILLSGLITALPTALLLCFDTKNVRLSWILWILHFLVILIVTVLLLKAFGWCKITPLSLLMTFLAVVFIYLFTSFVHYLVDRKHASIMNKQLKKRYTKNDTDKSPNHTSESA